MKHETFLNILLISATAGLITACSGRLTEVSSPDGKIRVNVDLGDRLSYRVWYGGEELIGPSGLGLRFRDHEALDSGLVMTG